MVLFQTIGSLQGEEEFRFPIALLSVDWEYFVEHGGAHFFLFVTWVGTEAVEAVAGYDMQKVILEMAAVFSDDDERHILGSLNLSQSLWVVQSQEQFFLALF